jgi:predicted HAD superfamily Cof-like phosphohydrolase
MKKRNQVKAFHKLMGQPVLTTPTIPSKKRCRLRYDLISEELDELHLSLLQHDKVEVLDALCDLRYVLEGTILECGMQDVFDEAFEEVHQSNMSKECDTHEIALATSRYYETERNILTKIVPTKIGKYKVVSIHTGKVLKSINYTAPDLKRFVS